MGDRRTAELQMEKGSLFLYTHWGGSEFPEMARAAIERAKPRLGDEAYYVRILVDELTKLGRDQETGFGLAIGLTSPFEDEYNNDQPSIIIDCSTGYLIVHDRTS